jgi:hypothetical protein
VSEPLYTTPDGKAVLVRTRGDAWQVAKDEAEAEWLLGLGRLELATKHIAVVVAKVTERRGHDVS